MSTISHIGLARSFDHATKHIMDLLAKLSEDTPEEPCILLIGEDKEGNLILFEDCATDECSSIIGLVELAKAELTDQILQSKKQVPVIPTTKH